jgi:autotransporter adhesin
MTNVHLCERSSANLQRPLLVVILFACYPINAAMAGEICLTDGISSGQTASGLQALACGYGARAPGDFSIAVGARSYAIGSGSVALGNSSQALGAVSVAVGENATATGEMSIALGNSAGLSSQGNFNTYLGVAAGAATVGDSNLALGGESGSFLVGSDNVSIGGSSGYLLKGNSNILVGYGSGTASVGNENIFTGNSSGSAVGGSRNIATGYTASLGTIGDDNVSIGTRAGTLISPRGSLVGDTYSNSVAIGTDAQARSDNSVAIGSKSVAGKAVSVSGAMLAGVQYIYAGGAPVATMSVGNTGSERQITNVAAGQVNGASTDAVNGSQLYVAHRAIIQVGDRVSALETAIAQIDPDVPGGSDGGSGTAPPETPASSFQISADNQVVTTASGMDSAAGGAGATASNTKSTALGNGAQALGENSVALGNSAIADRANAVSVGNAIQQRQVTNVAAGTQATDAVNVAQLNSGMQSTLTQANAYTDDRFSGIDRDMRALDRSQRGGVAAAMSMASMPQAYVAGKNMAAVGVASYEGESAISIGGSHVSEDGRFVVKLQGSHNTLGDWGVGAGAGIQW